MNLTRTFSKLNNLDRRLFVGASKLSLLDHDDDVGYGEIVEVTSGWTVSESDGGDGESVGQLTLSLTEGGELTAEVLSTFAAVGLIQPGWTVAKVCKVVARTEPLGTFARIWNFSITPTNEQWEI